MALLEIVQYPDPVLREICAPVETVTDEIRGLLDNMVETMYDAPGIGLAAPQVGSLHRICVIDVGSEEEGDETPTLLKLINPEIVVMEGNTESEEGCLSITPIRENVKRYERVAVEALNEHGESFSLEAEGILAICLQHEIDHLDGVLFIDHLSKLKQQLVKSKLRKLARG